MDKEQKLEAAKKLLSTYQSIKGGNLNDQQFVGALSDLTHNSKQLGIPEDVVQGKAQSLMKDYSAKGAQAEPQGFWSGLAQSITQPVQDIGATVAHETTGALGAGIGALGDVFKFFGGNGDSLKKVSEGLQQQAQGEAIHGMPGTFGGTATPIGAKQSLEADTGARSRSSALMSTAGQAAGTGLQAGSLLVSPELGLLKAPLAISALQAGGQAVSDVSTGKKKPGEAATEALVGTLSGTLFGGAFGLGVNAVSNLLGTAASRVLSSPIMKDIGDQLSSHIETVKNFMKTKTDTSPELIQNAIDDITDKTNQFKKITVKSVGEELPERAPEQTFSKIKDQFENGGGEMRSERVKAYGEVFDPARNVTVPSENYSGLSAKLDEIQTRVGDQSIKDGSYENPDTQKFLGWINTLNHQLTSKGEVPMANLENYVLTRNPSFNNGKFDRMTGQVLGELRDTTKSALPEELQAAWEKGATLNKKIDEQFDTTIREKMNSSSSMDEFIRQLVTGETKGNENAVNFLMKNLDSQTQQDFRNEIIAQVKQRQMDLLEQNGYTPENYKIAADEVSKFVKTHARDALLTPEDKTNLLGWSEIMRHDFVGDAKKALSGKVEGVDEAALAQTKEAGVQAKSLEGVQNAITEGNYSEIGDKISKMSQEEKTKILEGITDPEQKDAFLSHAVTSHIQDSLPDLSAEVGKPAYEALAPLAKGVKGLVEDKAIFDNLSVKEQKAFIKLQASLDAMSYEKPDKLPANVSKIIIGTILMPLGHPFWGMGNIMHGTTNIAKDWLDHPAEAQAALTKAQELLGTKNPTMSNVLNWVSGALKNPNFNRVVQQEATTEGVKVTK